MTAHLQQKCWLYAYVIIIIIIIIIIVIVSIVAYRGSMSHPCCMKAPSENHRLLKMVKLLVTAGPSVLSSMFHSSGLNLLTRNRTTLTPTSPCAHVKGQRQGHVTLECHVTTLQQCRDQGQRQGHVTLECHRTTLTPMYAKMTHIQIS